jgi:hypothetical protein
MESRGRGVLDTPHSRGAGEPGYARIQIVPIGILLLNQSDISGPIPLLQPRFALDRFFEVIELFELHEPRNLVFLRKALCQLQPMLADAADEVIGHTNVKRPSDSAGKDVDVEAVCSHRPPLDTGSPGPVYAKASTGLRS